jgi:hypothetical protein
VPCHTDPQPGPRKLPSQLASQAQLEKTGMRTRDSHFFRNSFLVLAAAAGISGCGYTTTTGNTTPPTTGKLSITTTSLPGGTVGVTYSGSVAATGGATPYKFSASSLPPGLAISSSGTISGTPAQGTVGTATVEFTVTDASTPTPQTATASLPLTLGAAKLTITSSSLPSGTVGSTYTSSISVSGGTTPYTYGASGLPGGLSIDTSTGAISGTPGQSSAGTAAVAVTVTDATKPTAQTATANLSLTIDPEVSPSACGGMSTGDNASLNGFVPFPGDSLWNADISNAPLDPNNVAITSASGFAGLHLHHDFSSVAGGDYGIPYVVVDSSATPLVPINVLDYASESDVADAPYPITAPIEGAPSDCDGWPDTYVGDAHVLVLDRNSCFLYETFNTHRCKGAWNSSSETVWDMQSAEMRP